MRFYIGKGAVPYGDHHPWTQTHEDNGKCGMAAVMFNLLGEARGSGVLLADERRLARAGTRYRPHRQLLQHPVVAAGRGAVRPSRHRGLDAGVRRLVFRPRTTLGWDLPPPGTACDEQRTSTRAGTAPAAICWPMRCR